MAHCRLAALSHTKWATISYEVTKGNPKYSKSGQFLCRNRPPTSRAASQALTAGAPGLICIWSHEPQATARSRPKSRDHNGERSRMRNGVVVVFNILRISVSYVTSFTVFCLYYFTAYMIGDSGAFISIKYISMSSSVDIFSVSPLCLNQLIPTDVISKGRTFIGKTKCGRAEMSGRGCASGLRNPPQMIISSLPLNF